jgi:hypothetical protein
VLEARLLVAEEGFDRRHRIDQLDAGPGAAPPQAKAAQVPVLDRHRGRGAPLGVASVEGATGEAEEIADGQRLDGVPVEQTKHDGAVRVPLRD